MKETALSRYSPLPASKSNSSIARILSVWLIALALTLSVSRGFAQTPGFLWSTNLPGQVIGVDSSTNVYIQPTGALGSIIKMDAAGNFISSNNICPMNGLVRRDGAGNYFFAGVIGQYPQFGGYSPGTTVNFGNGVVIGTNDYAIAKYTSAGSLIWARGFGPSQFFHTDRVYLTSLEIDPNGAAYVGSAFSYQEDLGESFSVDRFDDSGSTEFGPPAYNNQGIYQEYGMTTRVGALNATGGYVLTGYNNSSYDTFVVSSFTNNSPTQLVQWLAGDYSMSKDESLQTILSDNSGNIYDCEKGFLKKRTGVGAVLWSVSTANNIIRPIATDLYGGVHVSSDAGVLARYDSAGNLAWSTNYGSRVNAMITDASGNRFLSRDDGTVARLGGENISAPSIVTPPKGGEIFAGSNFTFTVTATGFTPFTYSWYYQAATNATPALISGATNGSLVVTSATTAQSGYYSVTLSNAVGYATSAPVYLKVDAVAVFSGTQMLTNGSYYFATPPSLTIVSAYTNGQIYYTLDGSTPSFSSTRYSNAFTLSSNAVINALAYSSDFSQSGYSDTVTVTVPPQFTLTVSSAGGGLFTLSSPAGTYQSTSFSYASNTVVTLTAVTNSGFRFLSWQGASSSTSPTIQVVMNQSLSLSPVFGTTLSVATSTLGQILIDQPAPYYPYGTIVRLEPLPNAGAYFATWGGAASGSTAPLNFSITNGTPSASALFVTNGVNQSAVTVLVLGKGSVALSPAANVFTNNQSVAITATPDASQSFVRWTEGTNSQTANPLSITAGPQNRVLVAHFTGQTSSVAASGTNIFGPQGFTLTVTGEPGAVYQIQRATAFTNWSTIGQVTNATGTIQFTDASATNATPPRNFYRAVLTP